MHLVIPRLVLPFALTLLCSVASAAITVTDDAGKTVTLKAPAKRILSLAPHVTEQLYAAGAGDAIVGTVEYSDFPEAAKKIPRIGSHNRLFNAVVARCENGIGTAHQCYIDGSMRPPLGKPFIARIGIYKKRYHVRTIT